MQDSTQQGDSAAIEVTNVDTAAEELFRRRQARQQETEPTPQSDQAEDIDVEVEADAEDLPPVDETDVTDESDATRDGEEDDNTFRTVGELAEAVGMDLDQFLSTIQMDSTVNGETSSLSLADLRKGFQLESDYTTKNKAFHEEKRKFEAKMQSELQAIGEQHQQLGQYLNMAQQELLHEYKGIDWNKLQQDDPNQWMMKRQQFGERQARIDSMLKQGQAALQQQTQAQQAKIAEQQQAFALEQEKLLLDKVTEWKDDNVREAERVKVAEFLQDIGYDATELENVFDHRLVVLARMAMNAKNTKQKVDLAKKKLKKAPKLVKGRARLDKNQRAAQRVNDAVKKAKKTGKTSDVAAALLARRRR